jgi:hypothetical protein
MTPERWERVQDLYHASRARPDRERAQFLADVCAGDDALRREVQALLDQPVATSSFVDFIGGPAPRPRASDPSPLTGQRLGSYQVSSLIGRGGMGEVYRAHDVKLGRDVAIKVLPSMFVSDRERLARFDSEARMLAALNHPHIGAIYGIEAAGRVPALVPSSSACTRRRSCTRTSSSVRLSLRFANGRRTPPSSCSPIMARCSASTASR